MKELFEKGLVTTLGATKLALEIVQDMVHEMIDMGKMAPEEGEKFLSNLSEKVEKEKEFIKERIASKMHKAADSAGVVTDEDLIEIKRRISNIEERLSKLEKPSEEPHFEQEPEIL